MAKDKAKKRDKDLKRKEKGSDKKRGKKCDKKRRKDSKDKERRQDVETPAALSSEMTVFLHMGEKVLKRMSEKGLNAEDYNSLTQIFDTYADSEAYRREFASRFECARDVFHRKPDESAVGFYIVSMFCYFLAALSFYLGQVDGNKTLPIFGGLVFLLVAASLFVLFRLVRRKIDLPESQKNIERLYRHIYGIDGDEEIDSGDLARAMQPIERRRLFHRRER